MKYRSYIVILSLIVFIISASAQKNPSFVAIKGGASFPFGKYHQKDLDGGSFALTGFNVSAESAWFFHPKFGVGANAGINFHPVDVGVLGWEKVQADPFLEDLYIRSEPYMIIAVMAGLYTQLPLRGKIFLYRKSIGRFALGTNPLPAL